MNILADYEIKEWAKKTGMIEPFLDKQIRKGVISYGLGYAGYDIRLEPELLVYDRNDIIDPKDKNVMERFRKGKIMQANKFYLTRHAFALGLSKEYFRMPPNLVGIPIPKSTYCRCGLLACAGLIEPGWNGKLVIELANLALAPVCIYPNEGIMQILFCVINQPQRIYKGKYQGQSTFEIRT